MQGEFDCAEVQGRLAVGFEDGSDVEGASLEGFGAIHFRNVVNDDRIAGFHLGVTYASVWWVREGHG